MDKQQLLEEHMAKAIYQNNIVQADTVNGMMKAEFVSCSYSDQSITLKFPVLPWQANRVGGFHGGVISIMFDITMAALARFFAEEEFVPTVSIDVKYLRPADIGDNVLVTAKGTSIGKRISHFTAEAENEETGKLLATAAAAFLNVDTSR